ncbi:MAG: hypothetical protein ACLFPS_04095 [Clostridia bacterium]
MLLTDQDIKILLMISLIIFFIFLYKYIKRKKYDVTKDIPGGKIRSAIKHLEEDGFTYHKTINNLLYNINADNRGYEAKISKRVVILKKGFKKYVLKVRNPKSAGKSINSKLVRYPFVEYSFLGFPDIIYYDYEKSKYRIINLPSSEKSYKVSIFLLLAIIAILIYIILGSL